MTYPHMSLFFLQKCKNEVPQMSLFYICRKLVFNFDNMVLIGWLGNPPALAGSTVQNENACLVYSEMDGATVISPSQNPVE